MDAVMVGSSRMPKVGRPRRGQWCGLGLETLEARRVLSFTAGQALDLNTTQIGTRPSALTTVGDELFFLAPEDGPYGHGNQLWKFDGTTATRLTRISSDSVTTRPVPFAEGVYFGGDIGDESAELWRYTAATGSEIAVDINPNDNNYEDGSYPAYLTVFDGQLYFSAIRPELGREVWSFDGTTARLAANINEVPVSGLDYQADYGSQPRDFVVHDGALFFVADDGIHGSAIWRYDGQAATMAVDIDASGTPGTTAIVGLSSFDGELYFIRASQSENAELWRYDGTGATRVGELDYPLWNVVRSVEYQGQLYYSIPTASFDWTRSNHDIWRTDGTGVERLAHFPSIVAPELAVYRDRLFFIGHDEAAGAELWNFDGHLASRATNINPAGDSVYTGFAIYRDELHFAATDTGTDNIEIWKYDGAVATFAANVQPGNANSSPHAMTEVDGSLYFFADAGGEQSGLFRLNGEQAILVSPPGLTSVGGWGPFYAPTSAATYFWARTASGTNALWRLANGGVTLVSDNCGGGCRYVYYDGIISLGDEVFFAGVDDDNVRSIWRFDGESFTNFPDLPIKDVSNAKVLGNQLYLEGRVGPDAYTVLRYDGSDFEDVTEFFDAKPSLSASAEFEGRVYYVGYEQSIGSELYSTDLMPGGARLETNPDGPGSLQPSNLTVFEGELYFTGQDQSTGANVRRLLRLEDGEAKVVTPELGVDFIIASSPLPELDGQLIFQANMPNGRGLWAFDGEHTTPIADLSHLRYSPFGGTARVGDALYFSANDYFYGLELWKVSIDRDADLDDDGIVGIADAVILQRHLGATSSATREQGDLDGDRAVNSLDAAILAKQLGRGTRVVGASPVVAGGGETTGTESRRRRLTAARSARPVRPAPEVVDVALSLAVGTLRATRTARVARG
jgi:ELWxxDGT repeat protein